MACAARGNLRMIELGVNIDHVATVRQARRGHEPCPVQAAFEAIAGGADSITVHLREDRRHVQDADVRRLRAELPVALNLEMAATDEMVGIACDVRPAIAMLVPEGRHEVTTEGGLDVRAQAARVREVVQRLAGAGIPTSIFVDADPAQIEAAAKAGAKVCEVHTGPYAHAVLAAGGRTEDPAVQAELAKVRVAGAAIASAGLQFNAGHGLATANVRPIATLPKVAELHIGHSIVSRAVFVGMRQAVAEIKLAMVEAAAG